MTLKRYIFALGALFVLSMACGASNTKNVDEFSFANTQDVRSTHLKLNLAIRFDKKVIEGSNELHLKWLSQSRTIDLDSRNLTIKAAHYWQDGWKPVQFELMFPERAEGQKLHIVLPVQAEKIRISYETRPAASGLQWLGAEQTAEGKWPFMFSQSQAIHARSWIPLQDSPLVRATFEATVSVDKPLLVVMSANNEANKDNKLKKSYRFSMPQAIPSYLIAIAAGDLRYQRMSKRTGIFAEPSMLASAVAEFNHTEKMIDATEAMYGPYEWGQYDLLILPPSFPFGGMENPRLSFITPTVIAGDKSLVNLIAHELAHSWSGNLVTNATWRDLWLNEGFTSYVENRIMEAVYGKERALMEQVLAYQDLLNEMKTLGKAEQSLYNQSKYSDPDDAFSGVPYAKGQLFLHTLEMKLGRNKLDEFLRTYFKRFAFQSLSTTNFLSYLKKNLLEKEKSVTEAEVKRWLYEDGLPKDSYVPVSDAFTKVDAARERWLGGKLELSELGFELFSVHEKLHFINNLPKNISQEKMSELDRTFKLTPSKNAEIAFAWFMLSIKRAYKPALPAIKSYLMAIGRMKFIVPLYEELAKQSLHRAWLASFYGQNKYRYHPIAQTKVRKKLQKYGVSVK